MKKNVYKVFGYIKLQDMDTRVVVHMDVFRSNCFGGESVKRTEVKVKVVKFRNGKRLQGGGELETD